MQEKKSSNLDAIIVGLALFAMFFGAGNLIFPPALGVNAGTSWFSGFMGFFVADAGLAIVGVFALMKANGELNNLTRVIGKVPGKIVITAVILCIGPFLAIPRTATVTFSMGVVPILGLEGDTSMALAIFSAVYFTITLALSIKPSKVVDIIGKFLTPILVACVLILIVIGFVSPQGTAMTPQINNVVKQGIIDGYNTMDAMASILFAGIIISAIYGKGYKKGKVANATAAKSAVVAGILLFIIYGGLAYLGATTGTKFYDGFSAGKLDQAAFLIEIVKELMGYAGIVIIGVVVLMACLTTSIGLTTTAGNYFQDLSGGKLKYEVVAVVVCIFSAFVSNIGLARIIGFAVPILVLIYPIIIFIMLVAFLQNVVRSQNAYKLGGLVAFIVSVLTLLADGLLTQFWFNGAEWAQIFTVPGLDFIHKLPLNEYGLNWIVPTIVAFAIGALIPGKKLEPIVIDEE